MTNWSQYIQQRSEPFSDDGKFVRVVEDVIVEISGPDAAKLLQGQVTADIEQINQSSSAYGALCTNKGRVISTFLIYRSDLGFYCRLPKDNAKLFVETLKKYAVFYKVEILLREDLGVLALFDEYPTDGLPPIYARLPHSNGITEIWIEQSNWDAALDALAAFSPAPESQWQLTKIQQGRPDIREVTAEVFLPHALSLDLADAISFTKGCYTGQEIVARTHYRGKSKKRLFRLELESAPPLPGTDFQDLQESSLGTVVNSAALSESKSELLVSANVDLISKGEVMINGEKFPYLVKALPWQNE